MVIAAHDTRLYELGKGIMYFDRWDANNLPTGLRDLGNAVDFVLTPSEDTLEHQSERSGVKKVDLEVPLLQRLKGKFTLDEYDLKNLKMAFFASTSFFGIAPLTSSKVQGRLDFWSANTQGPKFHVALWSVLLKPTSDIAFITDDWGKIGFELTVQDDTANHATQPYGVITPLLGWS